MSAFEMQKQQAYVLPCSPTRKCLDRFSILDMEEDDTGLVPLWLLLEAVLREPVTTTVQLIDVLETLSCTIHGSSGVADYGTLRAVVDRMETRFFDTIWPKIAEFSLQLLRYFPDGSICILAPGSTLRLSSGGVASLVAHQFLCTLDCPSWRDGYHDFSIWYASQQRHRAAAEMYLAALLVYFEELPHPSTLPGRAETTAGPVLSLCSYETMQSKSYDDRSSVKLREISIVQVETYSSKQQERSYQGSNGAVVVSANKDIGFGQSATQEEIYVGNCPEACPAVLFTPTLQGEHVLVIEGASPMLRISGQRRHVSWEILDPQARRGGRMLFMDALEVDEVGGSMGLPDLYPQNVEREIRKAYTAFASWDGIPAQKIWAGIWGCGAFNGDPVVKMVIMWIAASLAGKELCVMCDSSYGDFPDTFRRFTKIAGSWKVGDLLGLLGQIPPDLQRLETVRWLDERIRQLGGDANMD